MITIYELMYTVLEFVFGDVLTSSSLVSGLSEVFCVVWAFGLTFAIFVAPLCLVFGIFKRKRGPRDEK